MASILFQSSFLFFLLIASMCFIQLSNNAIRPAIKDALQHPIRNHVCSSATCVARSVSVSHLELTAIRRNVRAITIGRTRREDPNVLEELDSGVASINKISENMTMSIFNHYNAMLSIINNINNEAAMIREVRAPSLTLQIPLVNVGEKKGIKGQLKGPNYPPNS
ncbi:hypothetical protein SAY87_026515 [Trapa incisa]|uniref:Uncharacterized protein n=1 Tax=Trapa incisa TaxID=236973 RepID=A0AAN7GM04_9MYRT|nr:hypothetical protein SAY87_026515 [Trapa incisa]